MREITTHKLNGLNDAIEIHAGEFGSGSAPTLYQVTHPTGRFTEEGAQVLHFQVLNFQSKPIQTPADFNGLTNESLLAVLIDRMQGFQSGPFACRENAVALTKMEEAMMWLQKRTRDRLARGVEGSLKP